MKTKLLSLFVLAAAFSVSAAQAQTATVVAAPKSPAPVVVPPPALAPAAGPNQIVYSPRLPSPTELTNAAAAQGLTVEKIEQGDAQVTAFYKTSDGQTNIVFYQLLPTAASATNAPVVVAPTTTAPTVYYAPAPQVVYYDDYSPRYYSSYAYPGYYYPPVSIGLGFGFRSGGFRGSYHGGGFSHYHGR